jgi:phosphoenolpyruvate synthase/pyruvate phosphate dikinase
VRAVPVDYSKQPLSTDQQHFERTALRVSSIAQQLEAALAAPQDIEGVVAEGGEVFVVQSRPQA